MKAEAKRRGFAAAPPGAKFRRKVNFRGPIPKYAPHLGPCWIWNGVRNGGYGVERLAGGVAIKAHRLAYELFVGPIPDGLQIDHLCLVHYCVNPVHLEAVTQAENMRRMNAARKQERLARVTPSA